MTISKNRFMEANILIQSPLKNSLFLLGMAIGTLPTGREFSYPHLQPATGIKLCPAPITRGHIVPMGTPMPANQQTK